jgi:hypothetical protein
VTPTQVEVLSRESLDHLEAALAKFSSRAKDALDAMRGDFLRQQDALDREEEEAQSEACYWLEALQEAEDDDVRESCASSFAAARERLGRIRGWQARARERQSQFVAQAARFDRLLDQTLPRCREFLKAKSGELRAYAAIQPEPAVTGASPPPSAATPQPLQTGVAPPADPKTLADFRLPAGFVWVPLAEISDSELAGVDAEGMYKKVPYATMQTGLRRLAAEVLPRLDADPDGLDRDSFARLDEAGGQGYEHGLQRIYEAFFCQDFIYLERRRGQEKFDITNGRHRIRVALDLGWEAIPARVKDLRS